VHRVQSYFGVFLGFGFISSLLHALKPKLREKKTNKKPYSSFKVAKIKHKRILKFFGHAYAVCMAKSCYG
jgi:hypothetical protein